MKPLNEMMQKNKKAIRPIRIYQVYDSRQKDGSQKTLILEQK